MSQQQRHFTLRFLLPVLLLVAGFALGRMTAAPRLEAAAFQQQQPKAFKSGGARSIAVLKEISATLKTTDKRVADMDKRVANIEKLLATIAKDNAKGKPRE